MGDTPREEHGFGLIELIVAMSIGLVVMFGAMGLLEVSLRSSTRITDRVEVSQRGRTAMEQMAQELRAQVCLGALPPIVSSDGNQVTFYADLANQNPPVPDKRQLAYDPNAHTLTETVWAGTGAAPNTTYVTAPRVRGLLTNVSLARGASSMFRFYTYGNDTPVTPSTPLAVPLSTSDTAKVSEIWASYLVLPTSHAQNARVATTFQDLVYVRLADAATPTLDPQCAN